MENGLARHNKPTAWPQALRDPKQILRGKGHASLGRDACAAPAMEKDCGSVARAWDRPVPVREDDQIIKTIRPSQNFVREGMWGADHLIVFRIRRVI